MKKFILFPLLSLFLIFSSCKENQDNTHKNSTTNTSSTEEASMEWPTEIDLDNGKRWVANPETSQGIQQMRERIAEDNNENIEEYHKLSSDLEQIKNNIIKECTMKGEAHENLHVYISPLLDNIQALGETENTTEAEAVKKDIRHHLSTYHMYFK